ncbi:MAG: hypothetical protein LBV12_05500 [Puniceicoccales bacterium]|jgi:hypothetical protein|nr:hypothetical protein [Puniceicoccales bacterium]
MSHESLSPDTPQSETSAQEVSAISSHDSLVKRKKFSWANLGADGFFISLALHVVLLLVAIFWVVNTWIDTPEDPNTFSTGAGGGMQGERAAVVEHKVQMRNNRSLIKSAPKLVAKGVTSQVSLPEMPSLSGLDSGLLGGMLSKGVGGGSGGGDGTGQGIGKGAGKNFVASFFGNKFGTDGLIGQFYDFKIDPNKKSTGAGMQRANSADFREAVTKFVQSSWSPDLLDRKYYKCPTQLTSTQIFFPQISTREAPKAFEADENVGLENWIVVYRGRVTAPFTGKFRFVGYMADGLYVRFNNKVVLESNHRGFQLGAIRSKAELLYEFNNGADQIRGGEWIDVVQGRDYPIEICIADAIPGTFRGFLMFQQQGVNYAIESGGLKLPVFRCGPSVPAPLRGNQKYPPHIPDGPIFQSVAVRRGRR